LIACLVRQAYNVYQRDFPTRAALALMAEKGTALFVGLLEQGFCRLFVLLIRDAVKENQPCMPE
jgi:hypothetical protein